MELEIAQLSLRYASLRIRDASQLAKLVASLSEHGQQTPVLVQADGDARILIDGYRRIQGLRELARDVVRAVVVEMPAVEALVMGHRLDAGRKRTALEEAWLLRELCDEHGEAAKDLARKLNRSPSWVSRRLSLVRVLPERVQDAVRRGRLPPQAAMKSLVPLARANADACIRIVEGLGSMKPSVRQMHRLYTGWRSGDAEQRHRIETHPRLYLEALTQLSDPIDDEHAKLIRELGLITGASVRARDQIGTDPMQRAHDSIRRAWRRARRAFDALTIAMEDDHAGPRYPDRDLAPSSGGPREEADRASAGREQERGEACAP
jgi:ParB/RepB/Spo0J family partition protein